MVLCGFLISRNKAVLGVGPVRVAPPLSSMIVGARDLMTSKAAGKSCVSSFVSAQRRSFMMAPVFSVNFGPHFGVRFRKLFVSHEPA